MFFALLIAILAIPVGVHIEHPDYFSAASNGKADWKYVGRHECQSGLQADGSYTLPVAGNVYFKQVNKDGTVSDVVCDRIKFKEPLVKIENLDPIEE